MLPELGAAPLAGVVFAMFLLSFIAGTKGQVFHLLHCQSPRHPPLHFPHFPWDFTILASQSGLSQSYTPVYLWQCAPP